MCAVMRGATDIKTNSAAPRPATIRHQRISKHPEVILIDSVSDYYMDGDLKIDQNNKTNRSRVFFFLKKSNYIKILQKKRLYLIILKESRRGITLVPEFKYRENNANKVENKISNITHCIGFYGNGNPKSPRESGTSGDRILERVISSNGLESINFNCNPANAYI